MTGSEETKLAAGEGPNGVPRDASSGAPNDAPSNTPNNTPVIYVCITCRRAGEPDSDPRPGAVLAAATAAAALGTGIAVREVRCLANCSRGPSAAIRANGSWTYVFGALEIDCAPAGDADIDHGGIGQCLTAYAMRLVAGHYLSAAGRHMNLPLPKLLASGAFATAFRVRRDQSTSAEAPRPARDRIDGRSPGSRVAARHRLPGLSQWQCGTGSPLTVAGAAAELERSLRTAFPLRSRARDRRRLELTVTLHPLSTSQRSWVRRFMASSHNVSRS